MKLVITKILIVNKNLSSGDLLKGNVTIERYLCKTNTNTTLLQCTQCTLFYEVLHTIQTLLCSTAKQTTQHVPERKVFYKTNTAIF